MKILQLLLLLILSQTACFAYVSSYTTTSGYSTYNSPYTTTYSTPYTSGFSNYSPHYTVSYPTNYISPYTKQRLLRRGVMTGIPTPIVQFNVPNAPESFYVNRKYIKKNPQRYYSIPQSSFTIIDN